MEAIISSIVENLLVPLLMLIASTVMILLQRVANNVVKYLEAKIELNRTDSEAELRKKLTETIAIHVKAAVANCMSTAEEMKNGGKLNEDQIKELNDKVYALVMESIPSSFITEGNVLLDTLGGKDVLHSIIKNLMEQYVYEYNKSIKDSAKG